jgi:hypothetical protein
LLCCNEYKYDFRCNFSFYVFFLHHEMINPIHLSLFFMKAILHSEKLMKSQKLRQHAML